MSHAELQAACRTRADRLRMPPVVAAATGLLAKLFPIDERLEATDSAAVPCRPDEVERLLGRDRPA